MILPKYSIGIGDRFGRQGRAQLQAITKAKELGLDVVPVWNKSHREHAIIGTSPADTRKEADTAVEQCGWSGSYFVDADHINLTNVDDFIPHSDFFTIDVADYIGQKAAPDDIAVFVENNARYIGSMSIPGIERTFEITSDQIEQIASKYLRAVQEAGNIYRHIENIRGRGNFITEVSTDEAELPQTPIELFFILAALAEEGVPLQTIAPKFTGRFNKGVDYAGDVNRFSREFDQDAAVIVYAVNEFNLPGNLKLSIHSGSDKFSIYPSIHQTLRKFDTGAHIKTAGTTWLEELIGLALAGGDGLAIAKEVYHQALGRFDELCKPYATVIDIDKNRLPTPDEAAGWDEKTFADSLRHDQSCPSYNPDFRQLLHVGYKIAAQLGERYLSALKKHDEIIGHNVTENIFSRHLKPIFMGCADVPKTGKWVEPTKM
jgi:tagaturonate epimerase